MLVRDDWARALEARLGTLAPGAGPLQSVVARLRGGLRSLPDSLVRTGTLTDVAGPAFLDAAARWERADEARPTLRARHRTLVDTITAQLRTLLYERAYAQGMAMGAAAVVGWTDW
jgi:hypothetical protein